MTTDDDRIKELNELIGDKIKVLGFVGGYKNNLAKCIMHCEEHGNGNDWGNPWNPTFVDLKSGNSCPKCSGMYVRTEKEALYSVNNEINKKIKVLGFINKYKGARTRCIMYCEEHGNGNDWGNPWNPACNNLKTGFGCPKCAGNYKETELEAIFDIKNNINKSLMFLSFIGKYSHRKTKCLINCKIHGNGNDWGNPWIPTFKDLKNGQGCPKCSKRYTESEKESLENINNIINDKLTVLKFIGKYKGIETRCVMNCKKHGNGDKWENPWNPTYEKLKSGRSCPKCSGNYICTEKEAFLNINNEINNKIRVIEFLGKYKGAKTRCVMHCKIHGNGNEWEKPWNPIYNNLKRGKGCPKCAIESHHLKDCIRNTIHQKNDRNIYFIKFKDLNNDRFFYKIGVSKRAGVKKRYLKTLLKKDNIVVLKSKEIETDNISALLGEYWALRHFVDERKYMLHVLKASRGGTECFKSDITKTISLESIIQRGRDDFETILDDLDLTDKERIDAISEFYRKI